MKINKLQRYVFNGLLLSCAALFMRGVSVGFNVYISGKIGAQGMGLLTLCLGIYGFGITFATSGVSLAVMRLVSGALPYDDLSKINKNDDKTVCKIMKKALCYSLFFGLLASFVLYVSAQSISRYLLDDIRAVRCLKLMSFSLTPIAISSALNGYFYAVRRVYKNVLTQLIEQGAKITIVCLLLASFTSDIESACVAIVAGGALAEALSVIVLGLFYYFDKKLHYQKSAKMRLREKKICKCCQNNKSDDISVTSVALPVAISAYVRSALTTTEHLLIPWGLKKSGLNSGNALASYGILHGMVLPLLLFPSAVLGAFSSLLVPELSSALATGDEARIKSIVSRVFDTTLLFALGVSGIFICFSYEIGNFFYSSSEAAIFIKLLAPLIPLMYIDGAVDSMLKGLGHQLYTMRVNIVDSALSVCLIVALLPLFGIYGFVAVIFITELVNTTFSILKLLEISSVKTPIAKWILKPIFAISISTVLCRIIFNLELFESIYGKGLTVIEITFTFVFYLIFSRIFGSVSSYDVSFYRSIFKTKK